MSMAASVVLRMLIAFGVLFVYTRGLQLLLGRLTCWVQKGISSGNADE